MFCKNTNTYYSTNNKYPTMLKVSQSKLMVWCKCQNSGLTSKPRDLRQYIFRAHTRQHTHIGSGSGSEFLLTEDKEDGVLLV